MSQATTWLSLAHLLGLALAVGAATAKLGLLLRCRRDPTVVPVFLGIVRPVTRQIIAGLVLLTVSGIGWLVLGYAVTPRLIVKLVLVAAVWVLGPVIDKVAEPRFTRLAPAGGSLPSPEFERALRLYLGLEIVATFLFYAVIAIWVLG